MKEKNYKFCKFVKEKLLLCSLSHYLHIFPFNDVLQIELLVFELADALVVGFANPLNLICIMRHNKMYIMASVSTRCLIMDMISCLWCVWHEIKTLLIKVYVVYRYWCYLLTALVQIISEISVTQGERYVPSFASLVFLGLPHLSSMIRLLSAALRSCSFFNSSAAFLRSSNYGEY